MTKHFCEVLSASGLDLLYAALETELAARQDKFRPITSRPDYGCVAEECKLDFGARRRQVDRAGSLTPVCEFRTYETNKPALVIIAIRRRFKRSQNPPWTAQIGIPRTAGLASEGAVN
jgi:hypothetical protein